MGLLCVTVPGSQGLPPVFACLSLFPLPLFGRFFIKAPHLDLLEESFLAELTLQGNKRFFDVIPIDFYIQNVFLRSFSSLNKAKNPRALKVSGIS